MRGPVAGNDALDAGVFRRSEQGTLRLEEVRSDSGDQDIGALEERDQLVVRGLGQVWVHEHFRAALLEVDYGGLARGADDHNHMLSKSIFREMQSSTPHHTVKERRRTKLPDFNSPLTTLVPVLPVAPRTTTRGLLSLDILVQGRLLEESNEAQRTRPFIPWPYVPGRVNRLHMLPHGPAAGTIENIRG